MDIIITNVFDAVKRVKEQPDFYRVLSISNPGNITSFIQAREVLYLEFDDVTEEWAHPAFYDIPVQIATKDHCRKALEFLNKGGNRLVHCHAGVSRSTAMVLGFLLTQYPAYEKAVECLFNLRSCAQPNAYVLRLMCDILGIEGSYRTIVTHIEKVQKEIITRDAGQEVVLKI